MPDESQPVRQDLLGGEIHTLALVFLLLVLFGAWLLLHHFRNRLFPTPLLKLAGIAARTTVATVFFWVLWQTTARFLALETSWSLWANAFIGGLSVEFIFLLYDLERKLISSRLGKWLLALRLGAVGAVLLMLMQPVFAQLKQSEDQRKVVVLVDDSGSMQIADPQMSIEEKMELAQFAGIAGLNERPPLGRAYEKLGGLSASVQKLMQATDLPEGYGSDAEDGILEKNGPAVTGLVEQLAVAGEELTSALKEDRKALGDEVKKQMQTIRTTVTKTLAEKRENLSKALKDKKLFELRGHLRQTQQILDRLLLESPRLIELSEKAFYDEVAPEVRQKVDEQSSRTRAALARETLEKKRGERSLLEDLEKKYGVQLVRFGRSASEVPSLQFPQAEMTDEFRMRTDLTGALKKLTESFEPENLAGVVLLSDARHNTEEPIDDVARTLGRQGSPIFPVLIGSQRGSKDVSVVSVGSPQSIFQGDRVRTRVELKADGMRGQKVMVRLIQDDKEVAKEEITVPDDVYRTTVRMAYQPEQTGIFRHTVRIDPVEGELFKNNNEWVFQTAVSDDRTNVLLIDDLPRWEFRYLRNLLDSRDKSVHLQYVLLRPDELPESTRPTRMATASAKFGDSEAFRLPDKAEEWKKFDAIILGDIPPAAIGEENWKIIQSCVEDRGALLVMIAGPNSMPHAYSNATFQELCPVEYEQRTDAQLDSPEESYKLQLSSSGRQHLIFQQAASSFENARIWDQIPPLHWRHRIKGVREGADVLAFAQPVELDAAGAVKPGAGEVTGSFDPAALTKQRAMERENALVVSSQFGVGKVCMLNFDHTWRFRYGIGDTYHHKFWGQVLRWGTGENLRAGNEFARLGTDKLTYEPGEPIKVMAKLIEQDYRPVTEAGIYANVLQNGEKVTRAKLEFIKDSHGMYEVDIKSTLAPGDYELDISGDDVERLASGGVRTKFSVTSSTNPIEFGDLSTDKELAARLASHSGGIVTYPSRAQEILDLLGPASKIKEERRETRIWDHWGLLALAIGLLTVEWVMRRRGGLV